MTEVTTAYKNNKTIYMGSVDYGSKSITDFDPFFYVKNAMDDKHIYIIMIDRELPSLELFELEKIPLLDAKGMSMTSSELSKDELLNISNRVLEIFRKSVVYH